MVRSDCRRIRFLLKSNFLGPTVHIVHLVSNWDLEPDWATILTHLTDCNNVEAEVSSSVVRDVICLNVVSPHTLMSQRVSSSVQRLLLPTSSVCSIMFQLHTSNGTLCSDVLGLVSRRDISLTPVYLELFRLKHICTNEIWNRLPKVV